MRAALGLIASIALLAFSTAASAQSAPNESVPAPTGRAENASALTASEAPSSHIAAETTVEVELVDALSSRTSHIGDPFALKLRAPIIVDGREVVPAGASGGGEVIDAVPSGLMGRQGRLIVAARFLDLNGQRVRIHGMQLMASGEDRSNTVMVASMIPYVGLASIFMHGGNIDLPPGAHGIAKIAVDTELPPAAPAGPPPAPAQVANQGGNQP